MSEMMNSTFWLRESRDTGSRSLVDNADLENFSSKVSCSGFVKPNSYSLTEFGSSIASYIYLQTDISSGVPRITENEINNSRLASLKHRFTRDFLNSIKEQNFEYGVYTVADEILRTALSENQLGAKQWINDLFVENFTHTAIASGILRVISHLEYDEIRPQGITMALAALSNSSSEVRECGIRACENWATEECLRILRNTSCVEVWLNDYRKQVVQNLEGELGLHAAAS